MLITPGGALHLVPEPEALPELSTAGRAALERAFEDSSAEGLLVLASQEMDRNLPPTLVFWRDFARRLCQAVCRAGEGGFAEWRSIPAPADDILAEWLAEAPPMRGLEYLTADLLRRIWQDLRDLVAQRAAECPDGPAGYLRGINPLWHLLGRVTFHLAENKRDPRRPFAFLATFTHGLSGQARLQHLPLADALKQYAAARDSEKLETLLEPVKRAADKSELVRELLETKKLFGAQAWTIQEAYRFLKQAGQMEEAGVVVRVPDWWAARRPPRPQVRVEIGGRRASAIGLDALLDFHADLSLDGEALTDEERRLLLCGTQGLISAARQVGRSRSRASHRRCACASPIAPSATRTSWLAWQKTHNGSWPDKTWW